MVREELERQGWTYVGNVFVDSGQLMICDPCYAVPEEAEPDWEPQFTYDMACGWDNPPDNDEYEPYRQIKDGVALVSDTCYGDGVYPVYIRFNKQGTPTAMMVDTDPSEEEELSW